MLWTFQTFLQRLQKTTICTDIYGTQLHFQNFMRASNNWMVTRIWPAGRSLNSPVLISRQEHCFGAEIINNIYLSKASHHLGDDFRPTDDPFIVPKLLSLVVVLWYCLIYRTFSVMSTPLSCHIMLLDLISFFHFGTRGD